MRLLIAVLVALFMLPAVLSFGVSPASTSLTNPDGETTTLRIINQELIDTTLRVTVEDENGFLSLEQDTLTLQQRVRETQLRFTTTIPPGTLPGVYRPALLIEQAPTQGGQTVVATQAVRHRVTIIVPQDGVHLDTDLILPQGTIGQPNNVGVAARNIGTDTINAAQATITVLEASGNEVFRQTTDTYRIRAGELRRFETQWTPEQQGAYVLRVEITYDAQTLTREEEFTIGTLELLLGELRTGPYEYGEILRLEVPVTSEWNQPLRNVYADMTVHKDGREVANFVTPRINLVAQGEGVIEGFWNTQQMDFGRYDINVIAHYAGQTSNRTYSLVLGVDSVGVTQDAPGLPVGLSIFLLVLALMAAAGAIYFLSRQR